MSFIVEEARDVPRQNVEVLGQGRFGLTLVFLGYQVSVQGDGDLIPLADQGETRRVVWAAYDARQDLFGSQASPAPTPAIGGGGAEIPRQELALGQTATLQDARVTPLAAWTQAGESTLRLRVENIGQTTLSTAHWSLQLHTHEGVIDGTIEEKQIRAGQIDFVLCAAAGNGTWEISTGTVLLAVSAD
jgi:hypothetical protein